MILLRIMYVSDMGKYSTMEEVVPKLAENTTSIMDDPLLHLVLPLSVDKKILNGES